jgi:hypothetical protein
MRAATVESRPSREPWPESPGGQDHGCSGCRIEKGAIPVAVPTDAQGRMSDQHA